MQNKIIIDLLLLLVFFCKLFEHFILQQILPYITTTNDQFGFKLKHSTDQCVFVYGYDMYVKQWV